MDRLAIAILALLAAIGVMKWAPRLVRYRRLPTQERDRERERWRQEIRDSDVFGLVRFMRHAGQYILALPAIGLVISLGLREFNGAVLLAAFLLFGLAMWRLARWVYP